MVIACNYIHNIQDCRDGILDVSLQDHPQNHVPEEHLCQVIVNDFNTK
jgi:hypothetical protein